MKAPNIIGAAEALFDACEAAEMHEWAKRNLESSDPLASDRLTLQIMVEKTASDANRLRKEALAKAWEVIP